MSSGIIVQFQNLKEKKEFLSLFDECKKHPFAETVYVTFKFDYKYKDQNGKKHKDKYVTHMTFDTNYIKDSIHLDYRGECIFPYYISMAISEKYKTKIASETDCELKDPFDFFRDKNLYHSNSLVFYRKNLNSLELDEEKLNKEYKEGDPVAWNCMRVKKVEDRLKTELYLHFFNRYKKYIWE